MGKETAEKRRFYRFLLTEGDVRQLLATLSRLREDRGVAFCLQINITPGPNSDTLGPVTGSIERLTNEMLTDLRERGDLPFMTKSEKERG